ncbi:lytic murein transglycosylase B [Steroidobacter sp. S1-65]|uniref:Lytic murein transglycosylase B n=1 Tax=Steroidobacter gossypii TaxID=2805490 RepID=A0ABS1X5K4_9GAMM|nr:lytic murein transglycosylase B [Steroidobacter gossypii]MBM0108488.1 lytic murein transglycosylase B [Steroidobacter gossypii]
MLNNLQTLAAVLSPIAVFAAATPALALDIKRPEVSSFIETMTREHGFEKAQLEKLLQSAETRQPILDAISRPAERVVPWHEYRDRFLTEKRINQGADFWLAHGEKLKQIPDPQLANVVVGILGVETSFGRITGRYKVLDALVTLGFDYPPRGQFFLSELQEFMLLSREEKVDPATVLGSYAGAMGAAQFISSSYRKWAVDGDGDGHRDLWNSWDDVVGSVSNYLYENGWANGQQILAAATLNNPDMSRFDVKLALNETVQSLRDKGVKFETELPPDAPAMLIVGQGKDGPVYRVGFNNFYVITRYNRSPMYAMAVHDLGEAIQNFMRDTER